MEKIYLKTVGSVLCWLIQNQIQIRKQYSVILKCDATSKQCPLKLYDTHAVYYMQPLYKGFIL